MSSVKQDLAVSFDHFPSLEDFEFKEVSLQALFPGQDQLMVNPCAEAASLSRKEENSLQLILHEYFNPGAMKEEEVGADFEELRNINLEIKSINNQSILLHGERIREAQQLLKKYRDGAFTAWLVATYGNRQTPYSILQYFELYRSLPSDKLRDKMGQIPKKAAYTLASRDGDLRLKQQILEEYHDEGQKELIMIIQDTFPLPAHDRRQRKEANLASISSIDKLCDTLTLRKASLTESHKEHLQNIIQKLEALLDS